MARGKSTQGGIGSISGWGRASGDQPIPSTLHWKWYGQSSLGETEPCDVTGAGQFSDQTVVQQNYKVLTVGQTFHIY